MNRKNWVPPSSFFVCSIHFVVIYVAADLLDETNPAWVTSVLIEVLRKVTWVVIITTKEEGNSI